MATVAFGDDGTIVSAGRDGLVRAFAVCSRRIRVDDFGTRGSSSAVLAVDGSTYAQLDDDGTITAVDLRERAMLPIPALTSPAPSAIALSGRREELPVRFPSGTVDLVRLDGASPAQPEGRSFAPEVSGGVDGLAFAGPGEVLAIVGTALVRFDTSPPYTPAVGELAGTAITGVVADAAGRRAVAVTFAGEVLAVEVDQLGGGQRVGGPGQPVTALQVIDDGTIAAAGVGHVTLVDVATGEHTVTGALGDPVTDLAADRTGLVVTGGRLFQGGGGPLGADALIDMAADETLFERTVAGSAMTAVAVQPAGDVVATGNDRGEVELRDARSDTGIAELRLAGAVADLAFACDGEVVVGGE